MALTDSLEKNITGWGMIAIAIVIMSVVILKFKTTGVACPTSYVYNATSNACALSTNQSVTTDPGSLIASMDSFVTALSEPKNWVVIFIIALIGFAVLKLFMRKK